VAKGKSEARWRLAWLAVSGRTRSLVLPAHMARASVDRLEAVALRGLHALLPRKADAPALIQAAREKLEATQAAERSKRGDDALADALADAVRVASAKVGSPTTSCQASTGNWL